MTKARTLEEWADYLLNNSVRQEECIMPKLVPIKKGYILVQPGGRGKKKQRAHRFIWEFFNGKIQNGLWVLHSCDNPKCINIKHLRLGTPKDNTKDMIDRGRAKNGYGKKITDVILQKMQTLYERGWTLKEIGARFDVHRETVGYRLRKAK